jgi:hypothetical protein
VVPNQQENAFFYGNWNENHELDTDFFFVHKRIISAVKRVEFVSDRITYATIKRSLASCHCSE